MPLLRIVVTVIALSQIVLGLLFLLCPSVMYDAMAVTPAAANMAYILGMFAARLLVYGVVLLIILKDLPRHRLWLDAMVAIQLFDLAVGAAVVVMGLVPWSSAAFPAVNAAIFSGALLLLRPQVSRPAAAGAL